MLPFRSRLVRIPAINDRSDVRQFANFAFNIVFDAANAYLSVCDNGVPGTLVSIIIKAHAPAVSDG